MIFRLWSIPELAERDEEPTLAHQSTTLHQMVNCDTKVNWEIKIVKSPFFFILAGFANDTCFL